MDTDISGRIDILLGGQTIAEFNCEMLLVGDIHEVNRAM